MSPRFHSHTCRDHLQHLHTSKQRTLANVDAISVRFAAFICAMEVALKEAGGLMAFFSEMPWVHHHGLKTFLSAAPSNHLGGHQRWSVQGCCHEKSFQVLFPCKHLLHRTDEVLPLGPDCILSESTDSSN